jgi:hypothetical protein
MNDEDGDEYDIFFESDDDDNDTDYYLIVMYVREQIVINFNRRNGRVDDFREKIINDVIAAYHSVKFYNKDPGNFFFTVSDCEL